MISKLKNVMVQLTLVVALLVPVAATATVSAAEGVSDNLKCGANLQVGESCSTDVASDGGAGRVNTIIKTIIDIFSLVVAVAAVIMIMVGGFRYITSNGDSGSITGAKNTILYAIIGLVIVAVAQAIVQLVVEKV